MKPTKQDLRVRTNIPGFDQLLKGGLVQGRNILLSGSCGTGKTTFAMQFVLNGALDFKEPGLYVTLEESREKITEDMEKFGFDIAAAENSGTLTVLGGHIAGLNNYMRSVDAKLSHVLKEIEQVIKAKGIKRVAIDSINLLMLLVDNDEERRRTIANFCNALSKLGCTAIFISETEEGSNRLSRFGVEEFVMDGVIMLYLLNQGSSFIPGIAVRKMRGSDHDKKIRVYKITNKGIVVYPEETMFSEMV
jgi:KaiC/GvpD/RAD55 family RecA-like ATPase